jgi:hypothetical protein
MNINPEKIEAEIYDIAVRSGMFVPIDKRSIRYKKYMIIKGPDDRWNVFQLPGKRLISSSFLKVTAFAVAKLHDQKKITSVDKVQSADTRFQKNYNDSVFYKNTMKVSKDLVTKDTALWRYEMVKAEVKSAKDEIDAIFYSSLA